MTDSYDHQMAQRFRGFLPVVVDVETGGFNPQNDALLEIAAVFVDMDEFGVLSPCHSMHFNIEPFPGLNIEQSALDFTGIQLDHPLRNPVDEHTALSEIFRAIRAEIKRLNCKRAVLVGHNAFFDHDFLKAAVARNDIKRDPFHPFSCFDTVSLAALAYGHTVLAKACELAEIPFSNKEAHSAIYDASKTAELFCKIVNEWQFLGGWPRTFQE